VWVLPCTAASARALRLWQHLAGCHPFSQPTGTQTLGARPRSLSGLTTLFARVCPIWDTNRWLLPAHTTGFKLVCIGSSITGISDKQKCSPDTNTENMPQSAYSTTGSLSLERN
jgi:hypothetical protein